jgi:hypothetical protein
MKKKWEMNGSREQKEKKKETLTNNKKRRFAKGQQVEVLERKGLGNENRHETRA